MCDKGRHSSSNEIVAVSHLLLALEMKYVSLGFGSGGRW